jgi:23S rRNA (adenine2503-C2)-methyltransferase
MMSLCEHDPASLAASLAAEGFNPVHAHAALRFFYRHQGQAPFADLAARLGHRLAAHLQQMQSTPRSAVLRQTIAADQTTKLLIDLPAGGAVESVLMPGYRPGVAAGCVSSQIGCAMGCDFCASTRGGLQRNLSAGEIVEQFLHLQRRASAIGRRLKTLVFMGMGEPLANFDAVVAAIRRIGDPNLGGLGWRQITVSTVGIVPGIDRLAGENLNVNLALSLHAPDDATRQRLIPPARRYGVAEVLAAARRFHATTGRIVSIQYTLLAGVNDALEQADLLAQRLAGFRTHVNVIPYNPIDDDPGRPRYTRPDFAHLQHFVQRLRDRHVVAHARDTRGDDAAAACGQLRRQTLPQLATPQLATPALPPAARGLG